MPNELSPADWVADNARLLDVTLSQTVNDSLGMSKAECSTCHIFDRCVSAHLLLTLLFLFLENGHNN